MSDPEKSRGVDQRRVHGLARAAGLVALSFAMVGPSLAQDVDCRALKAQIDATMEDANRDAGAAQAMRRQIYDLQRAQDDYAALGCSGSGFPFGEASPDCEGIETRIERLRSAVAELQNQARDRQEDGGDRRRALMDDFNRMCGAGSEVAPDTPADAPPDPDNPPAGGEGGPTKEVRALCVRHCDGGYFPITDRTPSSESRLSDLGKLCQAMCPGVEASLYTVAPGGGIEAATAPDGAPYTALPAAFKFQKTFDATCSCKPAGKSWAEALAGAETLLEGGKSDVTVTQKMSDEMMKTGTVRQAGTPDPGLPGSGKPATAKAARAPKRKAAATAAQADQGLPAPPDVQGGADDLMRQLRRDGPAL